MIKNFIYLFSIAIFASCNVDDCSENLGFKLDYHLFNEISIDNNSYCDLVNRSLKKDMDAILWLSKVNVQNFASYQHGATMIIIIDKISEKEYLKVFNLLTQKEKENIFSDIEAGVDFIDKKLIRKSNLKFSLLRRALND